MSDIQAINVKQSSQSEKQEQQHVDIGQFAKRLSSLASNTAQALYTVFHLHDSAMEINTIENLAYKSFALAAALSSLADDLIPGESEHSKEQEVWTKEHHINLLHSFIKCEGIFGVIDSAVGWADEHFSISNGPTKGEDWIDRFALNNPHEALMSIRSCYHLVMQTKVIARHAALTRKEHRVDGGQFESLRLTRALQHPVLAGIRVSKDGPSISEQSQTSSKPSNVPSTSAVNAPKAERRYQAVLESRLKRNSNTAVAKSSTAPASTFVKKTVPGHSTSWDLLSSSTPHAGPASITLGQPGTIRPASHSETLFGKTTTTGRLANYSKSNANPFTTTPHLEAYILRLTVTSTDTASTLSYEVESLRLSKEALEAKARSSIGPNLSNVLLDLHPRQLLLIQLHAQKRQGHVLCVEHGTSVTLPTLMGNLQVRPTMFIIHTTAMLPQEPFEASLTAAAKSDPMPTAGENLGGNLFDSTAWQEGFGSSNTGIVGGLTHHLSTPEAYTSAAPSSASCASFGTPSTTSTAARRPEAGLCGGNTSVDTTPPITNKSFEWPTGKPSLPGTAPAIPAKPASGPWGQSSGTASASASASVPFRVKHTFRSSPESKQRLQDYTRQLREHEERFKLSLLARRTDSIPLYDDAALDALLKSEKRAPASPRAEEDDDKDEDKDRSEKRPHVTDSALDSNLTAEVATAPKVPEDDSSSTGKDHEDLFGARLKNIESTGDTGR